jgi:recombination protein RecA
VLVFLEERKLMAKPFDISKFRKEITKSIDGLSIGFNDPTDWISTGNYALNYLISGDFHRGIPLGKVTVFAGESGAGKSYICSGNIIKNAQEQGIFVVLIDSENALDEDWLKALGVDTSESKLLKLSMAMIDDVAKTISTFMSDYKALPDGERPKVLFVIDSLGMLLTPTDINQFDSGDLKGDLGRKPKALTALVRNCVNMFGSYNVGLVCTNHTYASQDMFDPDDKISGGQGFIYASSIVVAMKKLKLKEDEDGNKISDVMGIRSACKVMKTRYAKPFEGVQVKIPYSTGMSPYSGLVDLAEKKGLLKKEGNSLVFVTSDGEIIKQFRKKWESNDSGSLDKLMSDFGNQKISTDTTEETQENVE